MTVSQNDNQRNDQDGLVLGLVVVAAGRGQRSGLDTGPKQYHNLAGRPLIARTLDAFAQSVVAKHSVVVIHNDDDDLLETAFGFKCDALPFLVTTGGETRQASVLAGLKALASAAPNVTHVMIHDAARPFVSATLLERIEDQIARTPDHGILPALPIAETIKRGDGDRVVDTLSREGLFTAQTPQTFPLGQIIEVHERALEAADQAFTDDASLFEWAQMPVQIVDGDAHNIKLTYPADFERAERMIAMTEHAAMTTLPDVRTGNGYDVHRFGPGDHVMLCGVAIPHDQTLSGHSDADVGLHALTDALLATCGAGDIGDHFPPSDPQWKGAASSIFLKHAANIVRQNGGTIMNADVSIVAESPKIAPHREAMCEKLAELLGIDRRRCSVKATTNETMGFVGRREGIAAIATATVVYQESTS